TKAIVEPALAIAEQSPTLSATGLMPLKVGCGADAEGGCEGAIWIEEASRSSELRAARRASPKRFSKKRKYKLQAGQQKTVPVRMDRRSVRRFKKKRSFKVTVVAEQKDGTGPVVTLRRTVRVFNNKRKKR
ncbi:MAG: hypothetical protein M3340_08280, partial [Actinomycetota bacterium]|nr:hypothetical protein [Actinomycetota bacterium]